jgi:hypothetical protein
MPSMLSEILSDNLAPQPDMELVGDSTADGSLLGAVRRSQADVVIVARDDGQGTGYDDVLYGCARLKVIEISGQGRSGSLYELQPHSLALGELSPLRLMDAIRAAARPAPRPQP